jgi:hypothetical protein
MLVAALPAGVPSEDKPHKNSQAAPEYASMQDG